MRVVLATNVFVSAVLPSKGAPAGVLEHWEKGRVDIILSPAILDELERVLGYPKLRHRYRLPEEEVQSFLRLFRKQAIELKPEVELAVVEADPTDNRYLECALAGEAQVIVSGDRHLLELGTYQGIQILNPAGFLALLGLQGPLSDQ